MFTESIYPPSLTTPPHSHERAYFCTVLQGGYSETYGTRTRTCGPLALIFHPQGEVHSDHFVEAGGRVFSVEIEPDWAARVREFSPILAHPIDLCGGALASLAVRLYHEFRRMDAVAPLSMEGLTLEIVAEASRCHFAPETRSPRWLERARQLLHARFAESLSLDEVAAAAGVHPVHLARVFRQRYRCTVGDYVRQLRVEYAIRALSTSNLPLAEIALAAGFSDQSHFTRTFKRHVGVTPSEFRAADRAC
jgi:AraC family transcriptional regulator